MQSNGQLPAVIVKIRHAQGFYGAVRRLGGLLDWQEPPPAMQRQNRCTGMAMTQHLTHLGFRFFRPTTALQPLVQCYWHIRCHVGQSALADEFLHPEGGSGVVFNFADPLIFNGQPYLSPCLLIGPAQRTGTLTLSGQVDAIGVRFYPGAAHAFFQLPLAELNGCLLPVTDLPLEASWQQVWEVAAVNERLQQIELWLLRQLDVQIQAKNPLVALLPSLPDSGQFSTADLARRMALGERQVERLFRQWVGLTPKQLARIRRVQHARELLKTAPADLTGTAYNAGYFDQAHFIHDFKQVVGLTPGQYRQRLKQRDRLE